MSQPKQLVLYKKGSNERLWEGQWDKSLIMYYYHVVIEEIIPYMGKSAFFTDTYFRLENV